MFYVGQKVVCINDDWSTHSSWKLVPNKPTQNKVYHIRKIVMYTYSNGVTEGLYLIEIENPLHPWKLNGIVEIAFPANRFRPVVEKKTDIFIFTAMLNPSKQDA